MPFRLFLTLSVVLLACSPARAAFLGDLAFTPDACMAKRECILKNALEFTDRNKRVWRAEAGNLTDGASIPDWAQGIIGGPWDTSYLKAAVLHDHYCNDRSASWRDTHLMFYDALVELGVSEAKAKLMYYAVYLGGPKWMDVIEAASCVKGPDGACRREAMKIVGAVTRGERYDKMDMHGEMAEAQSMIERNPDVQLRELEAIAERKHPENGFYDKGATILDGVARSLGLW